MMSKSDHEVVSYLKNLLNYKDPQTKKFIIDVLQRKQTGDIAVINLTGNVQLLVEFRCEGFEENGEISRLSLFKNLTTPAGRSVPRDSEL